MKKKRKPGEFFFIFRHVKGEVLLKDGFKTDDDGNPILKHRLYAYESNRVAHKIYLNPKTK